MKATVIKRIDPCSCGCQGQDPWHLKTYERVLTNVEDNPGSCWVTAGMKIRYTKTATAQLPWGVTTVVYYAYGETSGEWYISKDSMLDEMNKSQA